MSLQAPGAVRQTWKCCVGVRARERKGGQGLLLKASTFTQHGCIWRKRSHTQCCLFSNLPKLQRVHLTSVCCAWHHIRPWGFLPFRRSVYRQVLLTPVLGGTEEHSLDSTTKIHGKEVTHFILTLFVNNLHRQCQHHVCQWLPLSETAAAPLKWNNFWLMYRHK